MVDDRREELGGDGQVIEPVAARAVGAVELLEPLLELCVARGVVEGPGREDDVAGELGPELGEVGAAALRQRLLELGAEVVVGPVAAGEADDREFGRAGSPPRQVIQRRDELAVGQVAGRPEQHHRARLGHPGPRQRLSQRVGLGHALASGIAHPRAGEVVRRAGQGPPARSSSIRQPERFYESLRAEIKGFDQGGTRSRLEEDPGRPSYPAALRIIRRPSATVSGLVASFMASVPLMTPAW